MSEDRPRRRPSRRSVLLGAALVGTIAAVRWSDRDRGGPAAPSSAPPPRPPRVVTAAGTEPRNPLVPSGTDEAGGERVVGALFSGLVRYDARGAPVNEVAASIESADQTAWTVTVKPDQVFSDGSAVTAACFVDAWDHGARSTSAQAAARFYEPIQGYEAVSADPPTASRMSGLRVVGERTFTITLVRPTADLPLRLGRPAFFPLPRGALEDLDSFGEDPVGNGPYALAGQGAWQHGASIALVPNPRYTGGRPPANGGLTLTLYPSPDAAWADLVAGRLDAADDLSDAALATSRADQGEGALDQPSSTVQLLTIPARLPGFEGEEGRYRRAAVSRAIDRAAVVRDVLHGAATPSADLTSPALPGWRADVPGHEVLVLDAGTAKDLWARAEAIWPYAGTFTIGYNADGGHQGWVDAVAAQITAVLGVPAEGRAYPTLAALRTDVIARTVTGAFRTGWQADYPGPDAFLSPLYATGAEANDGDYSSPRLDALLAQAGAAGSAEAGEAALRQAQGVLLTDLPSIPLWCVDATGGYDAQAVKGVRLGWDGLPAYEEIVPL